MSKQIVANYSFSASAKTVTLTDFSTIRLDRIELIVDTTTNKILYNFADSSVASGVVATNVLTLSTLQGGESNTDKLAIFYDALTGDPTYDTPPLANNAAKETGGNLTTINTNTAPLLVSNAGGYIRQDSTATIAKESGGNLATLAGAVSSSVFQDNIKQINGGTAANSQLTGSLAVGGGVATNTALTSGTYPLLIAGSDYGGTAKIQNWKVDSSGNGQVNVAQMNGIATSMGNGATDTGTQRVTLSSDSTGQVIVLGNVASGASDSGNPVKVAGKYNSSAPSFSNGQRGDLQLTSGGNLKVQLYADGTTNVTNSTDGNSDGNSGNGFGLTVASRNLVYNGSSWDRKRGNQDNISLIASAAYTTTQTGSDQTNYNARGVIIILDMTTVGTGNVTLEIDGKDPVSGKYYALLTGAAVSSNSTNVYTVYPGGPATANVSANSPLPRTWRVKVTANNANSATYSVGASLIL